MNRAATLAAVLALAPLTLSPVAAPADTAKALPGKAVTIQTPVATVKSATSAVLTSAPAAAAPTATVPAPTAPKTPPPASTAPTAPTPATTTAPAPAAPPSTNQPAPKQDSVVARQYKVGNRPYSDKEAKQFLTVLNFKPKGKPESTAVNIIYRDARGATLAYEKALSEWAYAYDTVAFLDPKEYIADSLIRTVTDGRLKEFLRGKMAEYAFVNFEKTMVQPRSPDGKESGKEVPAYYIGRYLRKLGGRYVLGDNFQARIGVGRAHAVSFISYREPLLTDSLNVTVPSKELVEEYLAKWSRNRSRLGRQIYPYNPDNLRIRSLKPVKVFESYVLVREKFREDPSKDGIYLAPRVTVLAEAALVPSQKRLKVPPTPSPVLLHFHFPCTPQAGLCWPDGAQGIQDGPRTDIGPRPTPAPAGTAPASPKTGAEPTKSESMVPAAPAGSQAPAAPPTPAAPAPAPKPAR